MPAVNVNPNFFNHDAQAGGFFPVTHINPGFDIDAFVSGPGKNMLVEGIRGTGKTHILKMISSKCIASYPERKILPIYISLAKVSEWQGSDIRFFRMQLYASIVTSTLSIIEKEKARIGAQRKERGNAVDTIKRMFGLKDERDMDESLKKIKSLSDTLIGQLTYKPDRILNKIRSENGDSAGFSGGKGVQLTLEEFFSLLEEKEVQYVGETLAYENAAGFIIEFFKQLKQILEFNYAILLLDECSEASEEAQIEIFRLLKLIRGAFTSDMETNYVYFFASVYPPYATKYPSKTKGVSFNFDPGQDAGVEYLQLDELSDDYEAFFHELTRKRLEYVFGRIIIDPMSEIFENDKAFLLAVYCANGIPRRYLEILKQSYDNLCQRSGSEKELKKISQKDVESAVQTIAAGQILAQNNLDDDDFKIIEEIIKRIRTRNKKTETENKDKSEPIPANVYFTISRSQLSKLTNLLLQGCIHDKGRTRLRKYYKEEGAHGILLMLDLSLSLYDGAVDKRRALDIFKQDLKNNAKSGYLYCHDFDLNQFDYLKYK
jgi:hypothetical protein